MLMKTNAVSGVSRLAALIIVAAVATLSISALCWTAREGVPPLSANSEFFAYSWIYAIRWGAGETIFQPHSQLTIPIFALINWALDMTKGTPEQIITGWRSISFAWPIAMMAISLAIIFATIDRRHHAIDAFFSAAVYLVSVPLFLTDHAVASLAYHAISIPLALAGLFFWRYYVEPRRSFPVIYFVALGSYAAICVLAKPTFIAFAVPFFAMEFVKACRRLRDFSKFGVAVLTAAIIYFLWILLFYGSLAGFKEHFRLSYLFMTSQANWYDIEKGATPLHWYVHYVIGKMGPLPTVLIATSLALSFLRSDRALLLFGFVSAIGTALFFLYNRSQLHAHSEAIAALATCAIASFRCSRAAEIIHSRLGRSFDGVAVVAAGASLLICLLAYPLQNTKDGFTNNMANYDAAVVPIIFQHPRDSRTIVLNSYPDVMWGVVDAWCRGSENVLRHGRSYLLDKAFGNVSCMSNQEKPANMSTYNRAVFLRNPKAAVTIEQTFPEVSARFRDCKAGRAFPSATVPGVKAEIVACDLTPVD
jgi:hypothetical protein